MCQLGCIRSVLKSVQMRDTHGDARLPDHPSTHPVLLRRSVKLTELTGPISYIVQGAPPPVVRLRPGLGPRAWDPVIDQSKINLNPIDHPPAGRHNRDPCCTGTQCDTRATQTRTQPSHNRNLKRSPRGPSVSHSCVCGRHSAADRHDGPRDGADPHSLASSTNDGTTRASIPPPLT